jgi:hypothetical protein
MPESAKVKELNDDFRRTMGADGSGRVFTTAGINHLGGPAVAAILEAVRTFDAFTNDNDPYGERDFGAFEHEGQKVFWKIDYYDRQDWLRGREWGSSDPADPKATFRVLTIMLASEY